MLANLLLLWLLLLLLLLWKLLYCWGEFEEALRGGLVVVAEVGVVLRLDGGSSSPDTGDTLILVVTGDVVESAAGISVRDCWFFGGGVGSRVPTEDDDGEGDEQLLFRCCCEWDDGEGDDGCWSPGPPPNTLGLAGGVEVMLGVLLLMRCRFGGRAGGFTLRPGELGGEMGGAALRDGERLMV